MDAVVQILKWLSQALILVGGTWALVSKTHEEDPSTGRRRLTHGGWLKLSILPVGFFLFALTELQNQAQQREALREREQEVRYRNVELEYLRGLFLLQHELSAVEISWTFSDSDSAVSEFSKSLRGYAKQINADAEVETNLQWIETAFEQSTLSKKSWLNVRQVAYGRFGLEILVSGHAPPMFMPFSEEQPEWEAFDAAIRAILGNRFEIEISEGVVLADLAGKHWPSELRVEEGALHFTIYKPGLTLGQLEGASLTFWADDRNVERLPKLVRVRSKDSNIAFDQQFELVWNVSVVDRVINEADGYETELVERNAGPYPLEATISKDILPQGTVK